MIKYAFVAPISIKEEERHELRGIAKEKANETIGAYIGGGIGAIGGGLTAKGVQTVNKMNKFHTLSKVRSVKDMIKYWKKIHGSKWSKRVNKIADKMIRYAKKPKKKLSNPFYAISRMFPIKNILKKWPHRKTVGIVAAAVAGAIAGDIIGGHASIRRMEKKNVLKPMSEKDIALRKSIGILPMPIDLLGYYLISRNLKEENRRKQK